MSKHEVTKCLSHTVTKSHLMYRRDYTKEWKKDEKRKGRKKTVDGISRPILNFKQIWKFFQAIHSHVERIVNFFSLDKEDDRRRKSFDLVLTKNKGTKRSISSFLFELIRWEFIYIV